MACTYSESSAPGRHFSYRGINPARMASFNCEHSSACRDVSLKVEFFGYYQVFIESRSEGGYDTSSVSIAEAP